MFYRAVLIKIKFRHVFHYLSVAEGQVKCAKPQLSILNAGSILDLGGTFFSPFGKKINLFHCNVVSVKHFKKILITKQYTKKTKKVDRKLFICLDRGSNPGTKWLFVFEICKLNKNRKKLKNKWKRLDRKCLLFLDRGLNPGMKWQGMV